LVQEHQFISGRSRPGSTLLPALPATHLRLNADGSALRPCAAPDFPCVHALTHSARRLAGPKRFANSTS
jgi:hypothetical protein